MILGTQEDGHPVKIDIQRLIETRLLLQANSGGGKSWAIRRLLEQTHGHVQQIVLDVEDEFPTLRESFDYVLAGTPGGDCPADVRSAPLLARRLLELQVSAIVGIYELRAHDRVRFVRGFLDAMVNAPRELWHPVLVVVDEAHIFAPQHGQAESTAAVIDLMTRGRKRGFCGVLATQRISKLHKDAAAEANNKMIGRSALDVDMKRAAEELGFTTREEQRGLRTLRPGEFFCFGPALSDVVTRATVGEVKTTHPRAGQRAAAPPAPKDKIQKVLAQLADLPKEADEEIRTVAGLQAKVRELEAEVRKGGAKTVPPPHQKVVEVPVIKDAQIDRLEAVLGRLQIAAGSVGETTQQIAAALLGLKNRPSAVLAPLQNRPAPAPSPVQGRQTRPPSPAGAAAGLPKAERLILNVLAQYPDRGRSAAQIAIQTAYAVNGGGFNNALGALRSQGLIEGDKTGFWMTAAGREAAGDVSPLPVGADLVAHWQRQLPKAEGLILGALLEVYPGRLSKHDLAEKTGYQASGGGFNNAIGKLRTLGLIAGKDEISLTPEIWAGL